MSLANEMSNHLPLYAYPAPMLYGTLKELNTPIDARLEITEILDSGEAVGGITCGIRVGNEALCVSLTYLDFRDEHPLRDKIKSYQKSRMDMLRAKSAAKINVVSRNAPCPCGSGKKYKRCCAGG